MIAPNPHVLLCVCVLDWTVVRSMVGEQTRARDTQSQKHDLRPVESIGIRREDDLRDELRACFCPPSDRTCYANKTPFALS
uniref:Putative secreted protein n=1 Tax=Anopheles marajoara TaxID=58244 RepID=A0A2M4CBV2_9DIPT